MSLFAPSRQELFKVASGAVRAIKKEPRSVWSVSQGSRVCAGLAMRRETGPRPPLLPVLTGIYAPPRALESVRVDPKLPKPLDF